MSIEVIGPDGDSTLFPEDTSMAVIRAAMVGLYGGPLTAGAAPAQMSDPQAPQAPAAGQAAQPVAQAQPDAAATAAPDASLAPLPPGGGYGPIVDAAQAAAGPWLSALASDPAPVCNGRLALFSQSTPMRDAAGAMAGSLLDAGVSPALAGLSTDPDTGDWGLPRSLDDVTGSPPTAATWLGLYNTLPRLMETDPWTGAVVPDGDSPLNANIARIAGHLSSAFVGDPNTGEGGAIPG